MIYKTAEEKLLADYARLEEDYYAAQARIAELEREPERKDFDPDDPPQVSCWKLDRPVEWCRYEVESVYTMANKEEGLKLTADELEAKIATDEGLREVCGMKTRRLYYGEIPILEIRQGASTYSIERMGYTFALDFSSDGKELYANRLDDASDGCKEGCYYPLSQLDKVTQEAYIDAKRAIEAAIRRIRGREAASCE